MSTRAKQSSRDKKQQREQEGRPRRVWWAGVLAVGLAVVGVIAWAVADGRSDNESDGSIDGFMHVHGLEIPAWQPDVAYLASHQGLVRIENGQWSEISEQPHDFMGFAAHPTESDVLYSSGHPAPGSLLRNPIGFMVSTDGGASWEVRSLEGAVDFHAMTVGAGGDTIYGWNVAGDVGLYRSTDDGRSWDTVPAPQLHAADGVLSMAAHPDDPDLVWAGTPAGLLHSQDAGASWEPVRSDAPVTAVTFDPTDPDRLLAYAPAPGDGLVESTDAGQSWSAVGWMLDAADDAVGHLAVHPQNPQQVHAGTYAENLYRSDDGGQTWVAIANSGMREQG